MTNDAKISKTSSLLQCSRNDNSFQFAPLLYGISDFVGAAWSSCRQLCYVLISRMGLKSLKLLLYVIQYCGNAVGPLYTKNYNESDQF